MSNTTKQYVDIDEMIFKHALFLVTSCNETNWEVAVETSFRKFATNDFVVNMAALFDISTPVYKKDMLRRIENAIKS